MLPLLIAVEVMWVCAFPSTHLGKPAGCVCFIPCKLQHCLGREREEGMERKGQKEICVCRAEGCEPQVPAEHQPEATPLALVPQASPTWQPASSEPARGSLLARQRFQACVMERGQDTPLPFL